MGLLFKNNAETTLSGGINDSVTTIPVASAAVFPTPDANNVFFATIDDGTNVEVVKVTGISSNDLTVVREQDNTSASAFSTGARIELRLNAQVLDMGTASLTDLDGDTKIQVEESADEDHIRFDTGGSERMVINNSGSVGIGVADGDVTSDGASARTYVGIIGAANRGVLSLGSTSSAGADGGKLQFVNGANVLCQISGDSNSGSTTAGSMDFFSSTGHVMRITNDSKIGVGTTSPAQNFTVSGNGFKSRFDRTGSSGTCVEYANGGTVKGNVAVSSGGMGLGGAFRENDLFIATGGNIGIGTTSPGSLLHVEKAGGENDLILRSNTGGTGSVQGGRLRLQLGAMSNSGSGNADTQAGDTLGKILFEGQGTDYSYQGAEVSAVVQTGDGDDVRGNQGTMLQFHTMNVGVGYAQEKFRIAQNGDLTATDTSIGSLSDERIKKNITDFTGGLDIVKSLQPRNFEFKDETGKRKSGIRRGFVAQEVLEVDDYWIYEQEANDKDDPEYEYTKDTEKVYISNLTDKDAMYVSAIKELQQQIEALQAEINTLKGE